MDSPAAFSPYYNVASHNSPIPLVPFSPLPKAALDVPGKCDQHVICQQYLHFHFAAPIIGSMLAPPPIPRRTTIELPDVDDYVEPAIDFEVIPPPYSPGPPAYHDIGKLDYPPTAGARRLLTSPPCKYRTQFSKILSTWT